jgi:hypothetical protein
MLFVLFDNEGCKVEKFSLGVEAVNTQRARPKVNTTDVLYHQLMYFTIN